MTPAVSGAVGVVISFSQNPSLVRTPLTFSCLFGFDGVLISAVAFEKRENWCSGVCAIDVVADAIISPYSSALSRLRIGSKLTLRTQ